MNEKLPRWYREFVLSMEGGLVNHPRDPGGLTNKGVTISTITAIGALAGIKLNKAETWQTRLINLSNDDFEKIQNYFFMVATANGIMTGLPAIYATELNWASGAAGARLLQGTIRILTTRYVGDVIPISFVDGIFGPRTALATNEIADKIGELSVVEEISKRHLAWIKSYLCPWRPEFCAGWTRRAAEFIVLLRRNAHEPKQ